MVNKLKQLFGSLRFWIVTLTFVVSILEAVASKDYGKIVDYFKVYLGAVVGIGTLDSIATKSSRR